jgi:hypothetical protein
MLSRVLAEGRRDLALHRRHDRARRWTSAESHSFDLAAEARMAFMRD